ncbi:MAG TPA: type II secretion system secretin GspD [Syntrophales bacterium]|nr:type II secretion system secretin GspD [Syntrophales bacterium]
MDGGHVMKRLLKILIPFLVLLGVLAYGGAASPARIAGQEGVVSVADETGPPAPAESSRKPVPAGAPSQPSPSAAVVDQEKKQSRPVKDREISIDFDNVDIRVFVKFMSELTGKNFVVDRDVRGNVTIVSPKKLNVDEAYRVFESVLEVYGFAAVAAGNIIKIIPIRDAPVKSVETRLKREAISPADRVITQVITLDYANPEELKKILTPLVSKSSVILAYPPTGMLVITDLLSNIERILGIISALDVEGIQEQISVIPLQYGSAPELVKSLSLIFQQKVKIRRGMDSASIQIVADERTNAVITLASENDTFRIRELIRLLDREVPRSEARVRVYNLQNAEAETLAKVLMNLPSKESKPQEAGKAPVLSRDIQVVPDKATNTLVITADRDDYRVLEEIIGQLDIPRPMVYIEALIMEVTVDRGFKVGVEWMGGDYISSESGRTKIYGGGFSGNGRYPNLTDLSTKGLPEGFSLGILGESLKIGNVLFPSIGAIVQAYEKDQDVHILSTPQILTLDNEEAEISVGQNVPYQTRSETSSANIDYSTYEYKDVGVTLRITPQISQERFVRLKIFQEVTKLVQEVAQQSDRPTTLKRTAKTTVTVQDGHSVVIGGLIGDDITNTDYAVPCLGNIPFLGWLFKYQSSSRERRNLYIFITPRIVENPGEARTIYDEKKEEIRKTQEQVIETYRKNRIRIHDEPEEP